MENEVYELREVKKKFNPKPLLIFVCLYIVEILVPLFLVNRETHEYIVSNSVLWFITKIIPLAAGAYLLRSCFIDSYKKTKENFKKFLIFSLVAFGIFYFCNLSTSYYQLLMDKIFNIGESTNQEGIYEFFRESKTFLNYFILFVTIVILAPILEELEFRYLIYKTFEGCNFIVEVILSGLLFGFAHMQLVSVNDLGDIVFSFRELLYLPIYIIPGISLALIYHYSNHNIFSNILVHMISNLISYIAILFMGV